MVFSAIEIVSILVMSLLIATVAFSFITVLLCYKKCPADKIMVIYGKVGNNPDGSALFCKCIHGGAMFIWPLIQAYSFLDLSPIHFSVEAERTLTKDNQKIDLLTRFTLAISTHPEIMPIAAERLLGLSSSDIQALAKDIIWGQLRLAVADADLDEVYKHRDKFLEKTVQTIENELQKLGLKIVNAIVFDVIECNN